MSGVVLDEGEHGVAALGVEVELGGERLEDRGLAGPVLADQERRLRVEGERPAQGPDGREGEREGGGIGDSCLVQPDVAQERVHQAGVLSSELQR